MLPNGWEWDEDGNPRPRRKKYRLSDLVIDEVSCVKSGANQKAFIVLTKSDDSPEPEGGEATPWQMVGTVMRHNPNPRRVQDLTPLMAGRPYLPAEPEPTKGLTKEQEIAKGLEDAPEIYDRVYGRPQTSSAGRELDGAALVLQDIAKTDDPEAIARLLKADPGLYDALLEGGP